MSKHRHDIEGLAGALTTAAATENISVHAAMYVSIANKMLAKGQGYLNTESARLKKMIASDSVNPDKKTNFMLRLNIIRSFASALAADEDL